MIEIAPIVMLQIFGLAFILEVIDSSTGQGYGTIFSPILILIGFDPKIVVPSILLSQAFGGLIATFFHNKYKNADFSNYVTLDIKKVYVIVAAGLIGVVLGALLGINVSKETLTYFIGAIVLVMGIIIVSGVRLNFTWKRMVVVGGVAGGLKVISGGGYGPLVTGGQVILSTDGKQSVSITDFAEFPICLTSFVVWCITFWKLPPLELMLPMVLGASIAPLLGCWLTYKLHNMKKLNLILGVLIIILGILCLTKILGA